MGSKESSEKYVTLEQFSRLEDKVDEILDRLCQRPVSRASTLGATNQPDTSSTHTYDEIPVQPGSTIPTTFLPPLPSNRPPPSGFTSQGRQAEGSRPGFSTLSVDLQKSMADNLNLLNQKVDNLEKRFFNRLTAEMTSYQTDMKKMMENLVQTSRSMDEKLSHVHLKIDKLDIHFCDRLTAQMSELQKEIKEMLNMLHRSVESSLEDVKAVSREIDVSMTEYMNEVKKSHSDVSQIKASVETIQKEIRKTPCSNTVFEQKFTGTDDTTIEMIKRHIDQTRKQAVDELQKTVESHGEKMKKNLQDSLTQQSQNTRTHVDTKMTENTKQLKDNMYELKRKIFAFTEKECQLVRDRIEGPLPSHKLYTFDFYVDDFKSLIRSGVDRYSPPWHINQFKSSIHGKVRFLNNGKLSVWMSHARHPLEVGLQPRQCGRLKIMATICDPSGKLADMVVGEKTGNFNEDNIKNNNDWGHDLGEIDCQRIVDAGYADIQNYVNGAVLVRYLVEVL